MTTKGKVAHDIMGCVPISDLPIPRVPSRQSKCHMCGEPVWLADGADVDAVREEELTIVCMPCVHKLAEKEKMEIHVTRKQLAEAAKWMKSPPHKNI